MRVAIRTSPAIDALATGIGLQGRSSLCRRCQERLRTVPLRTVPPVRRAAFSAFAGRRDRSARTIRGTDAYEPAEDWDGLEWIGLREWLDARDARPITHTTFLPEDKLVEPQDISRALHRASVEGFALAAAGHSASEKFYAEVKSDLEDTTQSVRLRARPETGKLALIFPDIEAKGLLCQSLGIELPEECWRVDESHTLRAEESWGTSTLGGLNEKFAIIKRFMQLSGTRISDSTINACSTPQALFEALTTMPKDTKVADALFVDERLEDLNNVAVYGRRLTALSKDEQVGRWKVIETELKQRGLPVVGRE